MIARSLSLTVLIYFDLLFVRRISSFVSQFLMKTPRIADRKELWKRSPLNFAEYGNLTLTLLKTLDVPTPSYVQILEQGTLSVTSFSLLRRGCIMQFDLSGLSDCKILRGDYLWPNELSLFKDTRSGTKVMLIPDGFLMPGQNNGGVYAMKDPHNRGNKNSHPIRITSHKPGWFYHRAVHVKLPGGHEGILTARAKKAVLDNGFGELVWITIPKNVSYNSIDDSANWQETVLIAGPDVMFEVVDLDDSDQSVEIVAAHFFGKKLSVHSLRATATYPYVEVYQSSDIEVAGRPYGLCLANLAALDDPAHAAWTSGDEQERQAYSQRNGGKSMRMRKHHHSSNSNNNQGYFSKSSRRAPIYNLGENSKYNSNSNSNFNCVDDAADRNLPTHILVTTHECSYDLPSAVNMAFSAMGGNYPCVKIPNDNPSTSSDPSNSGLSDTSQTGGSLYAYKLPDIKRKRRIRPSSFGLEKKDVATTPSALSVSADSSSGIMAVSDGSVGNDPKEGSLSHDRTSSLSTTEEEQTKIFSIGRNDFQKVDAPKKIDISEWQRSTLHKGFKVRGWGGIFSPGAPGFPYVFRIPGMSQSPPLILVAGDCTGSAYIFSPSPVEPGSALSYKLAFEIECGATVGSAAVSLVDDGSNDVNLYIPSYELNKVSQFRCVEMYSHSDYTCAIL